MKCWQFVAHVYIAIFVLISGCATNGPGVVDQDFEKSIQTLNLNDDIHYAIAASWFPNTILGNANSFNNASVEGRLFLTSEQMIVAIYDEPTKSYLEGYSVLFSDIQWMTSKNHGLSRILRFQSNKQVQSFLFGNEKDSDNVVEFVLSKVN